MDLITQILKEIAASRMWVVLCNNINWVKVKHYLLDTVPLHINIPCPAAGDLHRSGFQFDTGEILACMGEMAVKVFY